MEHLQEAWGTVHASLIFADKKQLLDMKKGVDKISDRLAKEIADFDERPQDEWAQDDDGNDDD